MVWRQKEMNMKLQRILESMRATHQVLTLYDVECELLRSERCTTLRDLGLGPLQLFPGIHEPRIFPAESGFPPLAREALQEALLAKRYTDMDLDPRELSQLARQQHRAAVRCSPLVRVTGQVRRDFLYFSLLVSLPCAHILCF